MQNIIIRKSKDRGYFDHGWLKSYHSFSFANYYDPNFMGFSSLRVINEDIVAPNTGFEMHPHKNMEIITYILSGCLTHSDNLGNNENINEGEVQIMTAGSGIFHSEWNNGNKNCHLLQIWIMPNQSGGKAGYKIYKPQHFEKWALVASNTSFEQIQIKQNASVYVINSGNLSQVQMPNNYHNGFYWLQVANGEININNINLSSGDAIGFSANKNELNETISFASENTKLMLFCL